MMFPTQGGRTDCSFCRGNGTGELQGWLGGLGFRVVRFKIVVTRPGISWFLITDPLHCESETSTGAGTT